MVSPCEMAAPLPVICFIGHQKIQTWVKYPEQHETDDNEPGRMNIVIFFTLNHGLIIIIVVEKNSPMMYLMSLRWKISYRTLNRNFHSRNLLQRPTLSRKLKFITSTTEMLFQKDWKFMKRRKKFKRIRRGFLMKKQCVMRWKIRKIGILYVLKFILFIIK